MYNFTRLIGKYSKHYNITHRKVVGTKIDYDLGGQLVEDIEEIEISGAIVNTKQKIYYDNGGYGYESVDMLYCYHKLNDKDTIVVKKKKLDDEQSYQVFLANDYSLYDTNKGDGLYIYELRGLVDIYD